MSNLEHWDAGVCPSCGTLYAEVYTLCECELPHNTEGVEVELVRLVRDSRLRGAVDRIRALKRTQDPYDPDAITARNIAVWNEAIEAAITALGGQ